MLEVNCHSSSSSCPSPAQYLNSPSPFNGGLFKGILNGMPRPSSYSNTIISCERTLTCQILKYWEAQTALSCNSSISIHPNGTPTHKSSDHLRKEIATLDAKIMRLEHDLGLLYQAACKQDPSTLSDSPRTHLEFNKVLSSQTPFRQLRYKLEPYVQRNGSVPSDQILVQHCDSQCASTNPKSTSARRRKDNDHRSLADHLFVSRIDDTLSPDRLSEDMIKCMSSIYCKLASPINTHTGFSASPHSSLSATSIFSSKNTCDRSSPHFIEDTTVHHIYEGTNTKSGPYAAIMQVPKVCLNGDIFSYASKVLQIFRLMIRNLEKIDPRTLKREEKLAFWINIHNALVMHAHLAFGTGGRVKTSTILKVVYNVGGHSINAYIIQCSILGVQLHHPRPLLQTLFSPGRKLKAGSQKHVYALEYPEPLVHFALCSGARSDPVVRLYSAKNIFHNLKLARDEFIQDNISIQKETKILLPKTLHYFSKDMSLSMSELLELINGCSPQIQQRAIMKCTKGRLEKCISWLPHSSTFGYVIHGELANGKNLSNPLSV